MHFAARRDRRRRRGARIADPEHVGPDGCGRRVVRFDRIGADGSLRALERDVAIEAPVAVEVDGAGYAVLMATPADLDELVVGLLLADRLIDAAGDIVDLDRADTPSGIVMRTRIAAGIGDRAATRVRHRMTESGCGLCGIESLEQALRPLPPVPTATASDGAVFAALGAIGTHQSLGRATVATHAAAACAADGTIRLAREDVGRHNALDKLIGAMAIAAMDWDGGFALVTSRCSYEMVEKAALARCPMLVAISAATGLALERAAGCGLALRVIARPDAMLRP